MSEVDGNLHRRLAAEGRLNLLFRLSEPFCASWLKNAPVAPEDRPKVIPFISRADHLAWRRVWVRGRWVRLSWPPDQKDAILRQDKLFREADERWAQNHGPIPGGARILDFDRAARLQSSDQEAVR
jgi:hypothetical protein